MSVCLCVCGRQLTAEQVVGAAQFYSMLRTCRIMTLGSAQTWRGRGQDVGFRVSQGASRVFLYHAPCHKRTHCSSPVSSVTDSASVFPEGPAASLLTVTVHRRPVFPPAKGRSRAGASWVLNYAAVSPCLCFNFLLAPRAGIRKGAVGGAILSVCTARGRDSVL